MPELLTALIAERAYQKRERERVRLCIYSFALHIYMKAREAVESASLLFFKCPNIRVQSHSSFIFKVQVFAEQKAIFRNNKHVLAITIIVSRNIASLLHMH